MMISGKDRTQHYIIHKVKRRHSNLWSHYYLHVVGQHGVLCEVVNIWRVVQIKLNQLDQENVNIITTLTKKVMSQ